MPSSARSACHSDATFPAAWVGVAGYCRLISATEAGRGCGTARPAAVGGAVSSPSACRAAGGQAQPVGERREDRDFLRLVLARLVVTQPVLMQAGQAGDLLLGEVVGVQDPDHVAEIAFRACVIDVLACADPLDNPAHLGDRQNHGALPVPLVARQPVRCCVLACRYVG
jgi:hypothetical protein